MYIIYIYNILIFQECNNICKYIYIFFFCVYWVRSSHISVAKGSAIHWTKITQAGLSFLSWRFEEEAELKSSSVSARFVPNPCKCSTPCLDKTIWQSQYFGRLSIDHSSAILLKYVKNKYAIVKSIDSLTVLETAATLRIQQITKIWEDFKKRCVPWKGENHFHFSCPPWLSRGPFLKVIFSSINPPSGPNSSPWKSAIPTQKGKDRLSNIHFSRAKMLVSGRF